jgi:hypothetical protein
MFGLKVARLIKNEDGNSRIGIRDFFQVRQPSWSTSVPKRLLHSRPKQPVSISIFQPPESKNRKSEEAS